MTSSYPLQSADLVRLHQLQDLTQMLIKKSPFSEKAFVSPKIKSLARWIYNQVDRLTGGQVGWWGKCNIICQLYMIGGGPKCTVCKLRWKVVRLCTSCENLGVLWTAPVKLISMFSCAFGSASKMKSKHNLFRFLLENWQIGFPSTKSKYFEFPDRNLLAEWPHASTWWTQKSRQLRDRAPTAGVTLLLYSTMLFCRYACLKYTVNWLDAWHCILIISSSWF